MLQVIRLEVMVKQRFLLLTNLNANNDTITLYVDNVLTNTTNLLGNTVFTLSGTTLTFTDAPEMVQ